MEGFNSAEERGIIPRAIEQIFKHIQTSVSPRMRFLVRASYLQIYNEVISDLLKPERSNLAIREDKKKGVFVEGLSEWVVRSPQEIYGLMERGGAMRATGSTKMNELSSRSHAVFIIIAEQSETTYLDEHGREMSVEDFHKLVKSRAHGEQGRKLLETNVRQSFKVGKLNLVDLAGSERVRLTGATGQRLEESKSINQSLSALGNVIAALTDPRGRQHIPYRDSKLTRILEDSLGGNCKTTMMAMISPALEAFVESLSTLKFANRAKNIKNEARVNEDLDQKSLLRRYERELKQLRAQLEERSRVVVDQRRLLELDEQRRRAEEDKMAAIRALEARSREFMREKAEKRALEERIAALQGQMLIGGTSKKVQESPAFRSAVKEHQERVRAEYEARLHDLEKERESIEEEKAQVDRYKQLLLKQRDIMILLTQRLNERDEQIVALQDELDAYDQHQRGLENKLDEKTTALIHLQRVTMEHNAASPVKVGGVCVSVCGCVGFGFFFFSPCCFGGGFPLIFRLDLSQNTDLVDALGPWGKFAERGLDGGAVAGPGGASSVPPKLLITTPQFRPYDAPTVFSGADGAASARESQPSTLLSAEDKIAELTRVVETTKTDRDRLAQDLEEIQAEKVSMEYLLREKLEKLVQSQIEVRLASYKHDQAALSDPRTASLMRADLEARTSELASAKAEQTRAEAEVLRLKRRLQGGGGSGGGGGGADDDRYRQLRAVCDNRRVCGRWLCSVLLCAWVVYVWFQRRLQVPRPCRAVGRQKRVGEAAARRKHKTPRKLAWRRRRRRRRRRKRHYQGVGGVRRDARKGTPCHPNHHGAEDQVFGGRDCVTDHDGAGPVWSWRPQCAAPAARGASVATPRERIHFRAAKLGDGTAACSRGCDSQLRVRGCAFAVFCVCVRQLDGRRATSTADVVPGVRCVTFQHQHRCTECCQRIRAVRQPADQTNVCSSVRVTVFGICGVFVAQVICRGDDYGPQRRAAAPTADGVEGLNVAPFVHLSLFYFGTCCVLYVLFCVVPPPSTHTLALSPFQQPHHTRKQYPHGQIVKTT